MIKRFALIGERLGHSLSVPIHEKLMARLGLKGAYELWPMGPEAFEMAGERIRREALAGVNVTLPYKVAILPQLDGADPLAKQVGAVNTVANRNGVLTGYNTDVEGLQAMLNCFGLPVQGHCAVLGSGGAARSACAALQALGAQRVTVISRSPGGKDWPGVTFAGYDDLEGMTGSLLINATPVGMAPHGDQCPVTREQMRGFEAFGDLVYNPTRTEFVRRGQEMGRPAHTGLYMLVAQAARAQEIWWDISVPREMTDRVWQEMTEEWNR